MDINRNNGYLQGLINSIYIKHLLSVRINKKKTL